MSSKTDNQSSLSWRTRLAMRRNRLLASRKFQEWASRTPLVRMIARRKAARQFDLIAGFVYSQVLHAYVVSGLVDFLAVQPRSNGEVRDFLGWSPEATARILRAGAAIDIAQSPQRDIWLLGEVGAALSANDGALAMVEHHALFYRDLADPTELLAREPGEDTRLSAFWTYAVPTEEKSGDAAPYTELMRATQPMVWNQIIGRYPFHKHQRVLDIGGGSGAFVEAVGKSVSDIELGVFDLPEVTPLAEQRFAGSDIAPRVNLHAGSFKNDDIPTGYDLITLVRILHDHDDDVAARLLLKIRESLSPGARLLILEPMAGTRGAAGMGDAYFGLYLWAMGSGRPRTFEENEGMVKNAGFSEIKELKTALPIIARALVAAA